MDNQRQRYKTQNGIEISYPKLTKLVTQKLKEQKPKELPKFRL